jgi:heptaprenyl diphosphate synthase
LGADEGSNGDKTMVDYLSAFGRNLGLSFQIVDDILDLIGTFDSIGKPVGLDVVNGVYTLPVIYGLTRGVELEDLIDESEGTPCLSREGVALLRSCSALEDAMDRAWMLWSDARRSLIDHLDLSVEVIEPLFEIGETLLKSANGLLNHNAGQE